MEEFNTIRVATLNRRCEQRGNNFLKAIIHRPEYLYFNRGIVSAKNVLLGFALPFKHLSQHVAHALWRRFGKYGTRKLLSQLRVESMRNEKADGIQRSNGFQSSHPAGAIPAKFCAMRFR